MKHMTFENLVTQVKEQASQHTDVMVTPHDFAVQDGGLLLKRAKVDGVTTTVNQPLTFSEQGFRLTMVNMELPTDYLNKLGERDDASSKSLFEQNLRYGLERWQSNDEKEHYLRLHGTNRVRALFSDKYGVADNVDVLQALEPQLQGKTLHAELTEDMLNIRAILKDKQTVIGLDSRGKDDIIMPALHFRNSETGLSKLELLDVVYRQVCTNGLVRPTIHSSGISKRHYGQQDLASVAYNFINHEGNIEQWFVKYTNSLKASKEINLNKEDMQMMLNKRQGVTQRLLKGITTNWETEQLAQPTAFAWVNAMTATARNFANVSERIEMERTADDILTRLTRTIR